MMEQVMQALKDPDLRAKLQREMEDDAKEQEGYAQALKARIPEVLDRLAGIRPKQQPNLLIREAVHEALFRR